MNLGLLHLVAASLQLPLIDGRLTQFCLYSNLGKTKIIFIFLEKSATGIKSKGLRSPRGGADDTEPDTVVPVTVRDPVAIG